MSCIYFILIFFSLITVAAKINIFIEFWEFVETARNYSKKELKFLLDLAATTAVAFQRYMPKKNAKNYFNWNFMFI